MSDNQRRVYCRILFLAICAFPTGFVGYQIGHPQTVTSWERMLEANLGVTTSIDSIETPGPYVTILRGLEFSDPDVGTLFQAVEVKIEFGKAKNIISIPYRVQGLTNEGVACLIKKIDERLLRAHTVDKPWQIQFDKDAVVSQDLASEIADLRVAEQSRFPMSEFHLDVSPRADGTRADLSFKVPTSNAPEKLVRCSLLRTEEFGHLLMLDSNSVALPCWLISDVVPYIPSSFGTQAQFVGRLEVIPTPGQTQVAIDGTFNQVDLEHSLRSFSIPPSERSFDRIELEDFLFENSVVSSGEGWIHQGAEPRMRINPSTLFSFTRKVDLSAAIKSALQERHANRIVDQYR